MSELARTIQAYELAESQGDTAKMEQLKVLMADQRDRAIARREAVQGYRPTLGDRVRAVGSGATFGLWDEIEGRFRAMTGGEEYQEERDRIRAEMDLYREKEPWTSLGLEAAGGLAVPGLGTAKAVGSGARGIGTLAGVGAAEGALAGYGGSEAGSLPAQAIDAATGALIGTGAALGAGGVMSGLNRALQSEAERAGRRIATTYLQGRSPEQIVDQVRRMGRGGSIAEADGLRGMVGSAYRSAPQNQADYADWLLRRQRGQTPEIMDVVQRVSGVNEMPAPAARRMAAARSAEAEEMFGPLRGQTVEVTENMRTQLRLADGERAGRAALDVVRARRGNPDIELDDVINELDFWHEWQRIMRGRSESAAQSARNQTEAANLRANRQSVLDDITAQGELGTGYQSARTAYREARMSEEALERGEKFLSEPLDVWQQRVGDMTTREREAMAVGAVGALIRKAQRSSDTANTARNLIRSFELREKLGLIMPEQQVDEFLESMGPIIEKQQTYREVLEGSPTAERLMSAQQLADAGRNPALDAARELARGNIREAAGAFAETAPTVPTMNVDVAGNILDLAMQTDPRAIQRGLLNMTQSGPPVSFQFAPGLLGAGLSTAAPYMPSLLEPQ